MFLVMFPLIPVISFVSAGVLWTLVFGFSSSKKHNGRLWAFRFALGSVALLNTLLFISTLI